MTDDAPGPASHTFFSQRLRLHYVDWGNEDKPPLLVVHGGGDHCRGSEWRLFHLSPCFLEMHCRKPHGTTVPARLPSQMVLGPIARKGNEPCPMGQFPALAPAPKMVASPTQRESASEMQNAQLDEESA